MVQASQTSYIINYYIVIATMKKLIYDLFIYNFRKNDSYDETLTEINLYTDCDFPDDHCFRKPCKYLRISI